MLIFPVKQTILYLKRIHRNRPLPDTTAIHCPFTAPLPSSSYYNGFFLIFANGLGYFFGVSAIFFIKMTRWVTSVPGME